MRSRSSRLSKPSRLLTLSAVAASLLLASPASFAMRPIGVTVGVGTLGYGVWAGTPILPGTLNVRAGFSSASYSRSGTYDKSGTTLDYTGSVRLSGIPVFLDYFPFHGTFRLTAGVINNRTQFTADATPAPGSTVTINGDTYTASQVGSATATLDYGRRYEPYLGIGWGNLAREQRGLTFGVDLGVVFTGSPTVSLDVSNPTNNAQLASDAAQAQQTAQADVNSARYWPLIQMGVGYNF